MFHVGVGGANRRNGDHVDPLDRQKLRQRIEELEATCADDPGEDEFIRPEALAEFWKFFPDDAKTLKPKTICIWDGYIICRWVDGTKKEFGRY